MKKSLITTAALLCLPYSAFAAVGTGTVEQQGPHSSPSARLESPNLAGFYSPMDTLTLSLGAHGAISEERWANLSLELDGIDVTGLMQRGVSHANQSQITYTPAQRLAYGIHELRLVEYGQNGDITEWGFWEFDVRHSASLRKVHAQSQLDLTVNQHVASESSPAPLQPVDNFSAQGVGQFNGEVEGNRWQLQANGSVALADDPSQSLTGREVDIPYFTIKAEQGRFGVTVGDHSPLEAGLLSSGYQQRGVSGSMALPALDSSLTVFSVAANQRVGLAGGFGLNDADNQLSGVRWQSQPWDTPKAEVYVAANYIGGKVSQQDYGSIDFNNPGSTRIHSGQAWGLLVDGQFMQRQLRVRLENSNTKYDFDGDVTDHFAGGYAPEADDAWSTLVVFQPAIAPTATTSLNTTVGIEAKRVGRFYRSIAHAQLPADKKFQRVFFNGGANRAKGAWFWDSAYSTETNNLEKDSAYAITDMSQWAFSGGYSPYEPFKKGSLLGWLGLPSYSLALRGVTLEDEYTPFGYIENNVTTETLQANAVFSHASWNWTLGISEDTLTDHSGWQPNTRTRALLSNAAKQFGDKFYLSAGWQYQQTAYLIEQETTHRQLVNVDANADFIPRVLSAHISLGANRNRASNDPYFALQDQSTYASANIQWVVREPKNHRAGLNLTLSVSHNDYTDQIYTLNNSDGYQAFLKLSTSLPSVFPGDQ